MHFPKYCFSPLPVALGIFLIAASAPAAGQTPRASSRHAVPARAEIRAIYLTGPTAGRALGRRLAEQWRSEGGNAVVFDIKDDSSPVSFNAPLALASHLRHPYIANLPAWVDWLHAHGLYAIARIDVFLDARLVQAHPELAVRSRATGGVWREHGAATWMDPSQPAVEDYNLALAKIVAASGVDEVQFDAIRFPVDGHQADARFAYQAAHPEEARADFITSFLRRAQQELKPSGVRISIDVYGITGWQHSVDLKATGQNIAVLAHYCDVICPMIYPSHFFGHFDGFADPSAHPVHFIEAGMQKFQKLTRGDGVVIRPWLQAFHWRTKSYGPEYVQEQVATEHAAGGGGFMLWNAGNIYTAPYAAMPAMLAAGSKYFSGGYPYAVTLIGAGPRVAAPRDPLRPGRTGGPGAQPGPARRP